MNVVYHNHTPQPFIELQPGELITAESAAMDLLSACYEFHANRILFHAENLPPEFYNLRTGLAGAVLQKFATYQVIAAAVIPAELIGQGRFYEMVIEANRGSGFHVYADRQSAVEWLGGARV